MVAYTSPFAVIVFPVSSFNTSSSELQHNREFVGIKLSLKKAESNPTKVPERSATKKPF